MSDIVTPVSGTFCWTDLQTTDPAAAREFYSKVLGWTVNDVPGAMPYAVATVNGKLIGGMMDLPPLARSMGAPPNWLSYVAVDDVGATANKAVSLGATPIVPPMPAGPVTFAVLQDPTGAVFAIWHTTTSMGTILYGEPGAVGWNELVTTDVDAARSFYTNLFGWTSAVVPMEGMDYSLFKHNGIDVAGLMAMPKEAAGAPSYWGVYFVVADADEAFAAATGNGAQVILPLMDVPTVGRFGFLTDPQGAMFALIRLEAQAN